MIPKKFNKVLRYGYSNTRVKAMKSKMLSKEIIDEIAQLNNISQAVALLFKTDYKDNIEMFGGADIETSLIDFALNQNLSDTADRLIRITPTNAKAIISSIVSKWDMYNIKLIIYAKTSNKKYEDIKEFIIKSKNISDIIIKDSLSQNSFYDTTNELSLKTPYKKLMIMINEIYKKTGNIDDTQDIIDKYFFTEFSKIVPLLGRESKESAKIISFDIEIRNVLMLIRAKIYNLDESKLKELLIPNSTTSISKLITIYSESKNLKELTERIESFNLTEVYNKYEKPSLLDFEIEMKKTFFRKINSLMTRSVLSIGAIIGFYYLKEREILILRTLIKSKNYNLKSNEIKEMIEW
jgi:V/A-type H+-transporting ATPase subunit C